MGKVEVGRYSTLEVKERFPTTVYFCANPFVLCAGMKVGIFLRCLGHPRIFYLWSGHTHFTPRSFFLLACCLTAWPWPRCRLFRYLPPVLSLITHLWINCTECLHLLLLSHPVNLVCFTAMLLWREFLLVRKERATSPTFLSVWTREWASLEQSLSDWHLEIVENIVLRGEGMWWEQLIFEDAVANNAYRPIS